MREGAFPAHSQRVMDALGVLQRTEGQPLPRQLKAFGIRESGTHDVMSRHKPSAAREADRGARSARRSALSRGA